MVYKWHSWLGMPKFDRTWHQRDIAEEYQEYLDETKPLKRWSELSDIAYTYSRARWSGHDVQLPIKRLKYHVGLAYMFPKYSGRFLFYKRAAKKAGANKPFRCVRNPKKWHKIDKMLDEQEISVDRAKMKQICQKQQKTWILLP